MSVMREGCLRTKDTTGENEECRGDVRVDYIAEDDKCGGMWLLVSRV